MPVSDTETSRAALPAFLEALGSSAPTPGGGAASALVGAIASALAEMVAQLTTGRPKFAAAQERVDDILTRTRATRVELLRLMDEDAAAYGAVSAAYKLPKSSTGERATREEAIQHALVAAMQPPLHTMERGCEVLSLAQEMAAIGNPSVASDAGCAAIFGEAAVRAAGLNVLANVVLLRDTTLAEETSRRARELETQARDLCEQTLSTVRARMGLAS